MERAALDVADDLPWPRVTVGEICRRAGVSERVFFNHFPTREDAFVGLDQPMVDEEWAARYVADASAPLITGAARLVRLPAADPDVQRRRLALVGAHPELFARAYAALVPLRERCRGIVADAIANRDPEMGESERHLLAAVIVGAASELLTPEGGSPIVSASLKRLSAHLR